MSGEPKPTAVSARAEGPSRAKKPAAGGVETGIAPREPAADGVREMVGRVRDAVTDRYEDLGRIAQGGMGAIDGVFDRSLHRRAVAKRIHQHLAEDARAVRMFVREAQLTGQLEHPNIVPVHELAVGPEGVLYFTMKLVEGRTLLSVIRELPEGALDHATLLAMLDIVVKVCDALAFAHSKGVLHCDVKPANVMVGDFGQVYLMDWGVARLLSREGDEPTPREGGPVDPSLLRESLPPDVARTEHGFLVGTPTHMAPEQAQGRTADLDARSDVFAVGALVYHIVTRRAPYEAGGFWQSVALAQAADIPPIEELAGEGAVPKALTRIVSRAMSIDPAERYQSVAGLRDDLLAFVRGGDSFPALSFAAGEPIVREGDPGAAAYIIQSGRCEVSRTIDGARVVLRTMGPGEVFGEMAILAPGPRTASVVALLPTTVRVVTAEVLEREVEAMKPWMGAFVRTLASRFREREREPR